MTRFSTYLGLPLAMAAFTCLASSCNLPIGPLDSNAPIIHSFSVNLDSVDSGETVTFSWSLSAPEGDALFATLAVDGEGRDDYFIEDPLLTTSQQHTYRNAGTFRARLHFSNGAQVDNAAVTVNVAGPIRIKIVLPLGGEFVGDEMEVTALLSSEFEIAKSWVAVEDRQTPLFLLERRSPSNSTAAVLLAGLTPGPKTVTVFVEDALGNLASATRGFIYDPQPRLHVIEPRSWSVASPTIRLHATCTDADPFGCGIDTFAASGVNTLDTVVDLTESDGQAIDISFSATDSGGVRGVVQKRLIYVEASDKLAEVVILPGPIVDVLDEKVLYVKLLNEDDLPDRAPGTLRNWDVLGIYDRSSATTTVAPVSAVTRLDHTTAFLTPTGAILMTSAGSEFSEWNAETGNLQAEFGNALFLAGDFALVRRRDKNGKDGWFLQSFSTGTTVEIPQRTATNPGNVTRHGVVALAEGNPPNVVISLYANGTVTPLTDAGDHRSPLTDGKRTLYIAERELVLQDQSAKTILPTAGFPYQINENWIVFTRFSGQGATHLWRRSLDGREQRLTFFSEGQVPIERLAPNGEVMFFHRQRRYLADTAGNLIELSSDRGKAFWIDGTWYLAIGRTLFRVEP